MPWKFGFPLTISSLLFTDLDLLRFSQYLSIRTCCCDLFCKVSCSLKFHTDDMSFAFKHNLHIHTTHTFTCTHTGHKLGEHKQRQIEYPSHRNTHYKQLSKQLFLLQSMPRISFGQKLLAYKTLESVDLTE